ncbi:E3 ubiquitin-protein ligase smurf1 [Globisporangium polare]
MTTTTTAAAASSSRGDGRQQPHDELTQQNLGADPADRFMTSARSSSNDNMTGTAHANGAGAERVPSAEKELIERGKMLLERYQQQRQSVGRARNVPALSLDLHQPPLPPPPPQFHSEISLLSSIMSSGSNIASESSQTMISSGDGSNGNGVVARVPPRVSSWNEFLNVQAYSSHLLDAIDEQMQRLCEFVQDDFETESFLLPLCTSIHGLLKQKRTAENGMEKFTAAIGPPVFIDSSKEVELKDDTTSGDEEPVPMLEASTTTRNKSTPEMKWLSQPQIRELVDEETVELQRELDESKMFIEELKTKVNTLRTESSQEKGRSNSSPAAMSTSETENDENSEQHTHDQLHARFDEARKLENRLQEKDELLVSLRASLESVVQDHNKLEQELQRSCHAVEQLGAERSQLEKASADKITLLKRAFAVKAKQLGQLCRNVDLPSTWQQVTDENGIIYFRQTDRACAPQLEDPRVPTALSLYGINTSKAHAASSTSPRSASGRMEQITLEEKRRRAFSSGSQQSSRHDSVDLTTCEDISAPPDDGFKHKIDDFATPLPEGWEMRATAAGSVFFVNRYSNVTTWKDPREESGNGDLTGGGPIEFGSLRVKIPSERKQKADFSNNENTVTSYCPPGFPQEDGVQYFDVVFKERGPIGIHFQANNPDEGATVRRLLPGTAAIETGILRPFDGLIAVNQHPVDTASFRHVMILLQGGLRPLTLSFKRDLNAMRRKSASNFDGGLHSEADLDEEVVLDSEMHDDDNGQYGESNSLYGERRRSSRDIQNGRDSAQDTSGDGGRRSSHHRESATAPPSSTATPSAGAAAQHEDDSVADKIITNLFSFFWTPPELVASEVQTV